MLKTQCSLLRPMIVGGLTATMLIFASTLHAQAGASIDKNKVIGEDGVKQQGVIGEEGLKKAPPPYEIVKAPDGNYYRLTPEQLKAIAAKEGDDKPPCKPKDCLFISAYGQKLTVPVTSLSKYKMPATLANDQIRAGSTPVAAQWEPPAAP